MDQNYNESVLIEKFLLFSYQIFENEDKFSPIIESNIQ